jgi:DNA-binding transcriptional regulator YhcF (GntR family)
VRRAYADLEGARLIVPRHGQGTFVAGEVEAARRKRALTEARAQLGDAVRRARQLGLRGPSLRAHVERLLEGAEAEDGRSEQSEKGQGHGRH